MSRYEAVDDPIEAYLDELLVVLPGSPRQIRHTLAEVEAHLLDAAAEDRAAGLDDVAARAAAVSRMGPGDRVADEPRSGIRLSRALRRRVVLAVVLIGGAGGIAVGVGGILGRIAQALWGSRAVAVPFPTGSYRAADCSRWRAGYPSARDCLTAMTADHADDFLRNAAAGGVLGLLVIGGYALLRRRWAGPTVATALPRGTENVVGVALALAAALVLIGQGVDAVLVTHGNGAGQPFSLAASAVAVAAVFAVRTGYRPSPSR